MAEKKTLNGVHVENVQYLSTSRGVAFTAVLYLDDQKIGMVENRGEGGPTSVDITDQEAKEEFYIRMQEYFVQQNIQPVEEESEFVDHLLDLHDFGRVLTEEEKWQLIQENNGS
jgi:hypothetical protein